MTFCASESVLTQFKVIILLNPGLFECPQFLKKITFHSAGTLIFHDTSLFHSTRVSHLRGLLCARRQWLPQRQQHGKRRCRSLHALSAQQQRLGQEGSCHDYEMKDDTYISPIHLSYSHVAIFARFFCFLCAIVSINTIINTRAKVHIITFGISELTVNIPHTRRSRRALMTRTEQPNMSLKDRGRQKLLLIRVFRLDEMQFPTFGVFVYHTTGL